MASGALGPTGCSLQRIYEGQLTDTPRSPHTGHTSIITIDFNYLFVFNYQYVHQQLSIHTFISSHSVCKFHALPRKMLQMLSPHFQPWNATWKPWDATPVISTSVWSLRGKWSNLALLLNKGWNQLYFGICLAGDFLLFVPWDSSPSSRPPYFLPSTIDKLVVWGPVVWISGMSLWKVNFA